MEPVKDQNKLASAETAVSTPAAATPAPAKPSEAATGTGNQPEAKENTPQLGIGERTQLAVNALLDTMPETDRPTDEYQLMALKTLREQGEDLSKLPDGVRAKKILDAARKIKAFEDAANAPKDALKQAVKTPGQTAIPPVDDLQTRFNSKDPKVSLKAAKEVAYRNLMKTLPPEKAKLLGYTEE